VITGRNKDTLNTVSAETGILAVRSDVSNVADTKQALATIAAQNGGIDILFANAGVGGFAAIPDVTEEFWDSIHSVNLRGLFFALQNALPHMRDGGNIVVTGSIGSIMALPGNAAYAAAKAGLRALVRIFATELLPRTIRVNMVSPGPTETPIVHRDTSAEEAEALLAMMRDAVPMKRIGEADEIAKAALFLASDDASFINGVDLFVDGGCVEL
jgi:NAD(P)-dependent dehydrogenase (short-subunit alcohol dehydrogenase family)